MTAPAGSLGEVLGAFVSAVGSPPPGVVAIARAELLQSIADSIAGSGSAQSSVVGRAWTSEAADAIALAPRGRWTSADYAAFQNASSAFSRQAPTVGPVTRTLRTVVVPALCASIRWDRTSGMELLSALAGAAELTCRLHDVLEPSIQVRGLPAFALLGPLGAAAAVARARRGSAVELSNAIAIAGSLASGVAEIGESSTGAYLAGWAAQSGLLAGGLGVGGFSGPKQALEGERGYFRSFTGHRLPGGIGGVADDLGRAWRMTGVLGSSTEADGVDGLLSCLSENGVPATVGASAFRAMETAADLGWLAQILATGDPTANGDRSS
jgi:2-methylcitrate dehydratase PrpD